MASRRQYTADKIDSDREVIVAVKGCIAEGTVNRTALIAETARVAGCPRHKVQSVLQDFTGKLWAVTRGEHNSHSYSLLQVSDATVKCANSSGYAAAFQTKGGFTPPRGI